MKINEKQIAVGLGSTQLTSDLFSVLLNSNDKILLLDPSYSNFPEQLQKNFLDIEITIKRNWEHYLFKVMLPVFLILCVAWYVLWIPTHKYEARLNTCLLYTSDAADE